MTFVELFIGKPVQLLFGNNCSVRILTRCSKWITWTCNSDMDVLRKSWTRFSSNGINTNCSPIENQSWTCVQKKIKIFVLMPLNENRVNILPIHFCQGNTRKNYEDFRVHEGIIHIQMSILHLLVNSSRLTKYIIWVSIKWFDHCFNMW